MSDTSNPASCGDPPRGLVDYCCHACGKVDRGAYRLVAWQSLPPGWFSSETEARGWWYACSPACVRALNEQEGLDYLYTGEEP